MKRPHPWEWAICATIPMFGLRAELLPVVFGTPERATWDWSFLSVTLRFAALPVLGVVLGLATLVRALLTARRVPGRRLPAVLMLLIGVGYAMASYTLPCSWLISLD